MQVYGRIRLCRYWQKQQFSALHRVAIVHEASTVDPSLADMSTALAQAPPTIKSTTVWQPYPTIYEINSWVWLTELSDKYKRPLDLSTLPSTEWDVEGTLCCPRAVALPLLPVCSELERLSIVNVFEQASRGQ